MYKILVYIQSAKQTTTKKLIKTKKKKKKHEAKNKIKFNFKSLLWLLYSFLR